MDPRRSANAEGDSRPGTSSEGEAMEKTLDKWCRWLLNHEQGNVLEDVA